MGTNENTMTRREFLKNLAFGLGGIVLTGSFGVIFRHTGINGSSVKGIVVDFQRCTGCRTCETVCSAYHHKTMVNGEKLNGLGNPWLSNIRVHSFNPDIDVPMVCSHCEDSPCIHACTVPPDLFTGHKALYLDEDNHTVHNNPDRCVGCGECARACRNLRTGIIRRQPENGKPFGICNLCDGDPQCVKYCTYNALSYVELSGNTDFRKLPPEIIAKKLIYRFYDMEI